MDIVKIINLAAAHTADAAKFLRDIVAIPSLSCQEGEVIQRIGAEMEKAGFDEVKTDAMGNLIGRIGQGTHIIAMDCHVDTVDIGNPANWQYDPFKGKMENGIIYGRGASDMKGAMAAMVYAAKIIKALGLLNDYTLYITGTVQEEDCDGLCWQYIINEDKIKPELVIIGEPTNLQIYRGQRGRLEFEIITEGISSHGAAPERGVNAIYKMAPIVNEIEKLNNRLKSDIFLGKGSITISQIRSGAPSLNAVADMAAVYIDRRLTTAENIDLVKSEIEALESFRKAGARIHIPDYDVPSYKGLTYKMRKYFPTWTLEENHPLLHCALDLYQLIYNKKTVPGKWGFSTNGVATAGLYHIPTFGFGPADEKYAHTVEDQCPVNHLTEAMKFYAAFPQYYVDSCLAGS